MNPSLADSVLVRVNPAQNNGSDVAPAVITRVWGPTMVNLRVLIDEPTMPLSMTSVTLFASEQEAGDNERACWWPPHV